MLPRALCRSIVSRLLIWSAQAHTRSQAATPHGRRCRAPLRHRLSSPGCQHPGSPTREQVLLAVQWRPREGHQEVWERCEQVLAGKFEPCVLAQMLERLHKKRGEILRSFPVSWSTCIKIKEVQWSGSTAMLYSVHYTGPSHTHAPSHTCCSTRKEQKVAKRSLQWPLDCKAMLQARACRS